MCGIHQIKINQPNKTATVPQRKYNFSRHSDLQSWLVWRWHFHNLPSPIKQKALFTPLQSFHMCSPAPAGGKHQMAMNFGLWLAKWPLLQDLFTHINDSLQVNSDCGGPSWGKDPSFPLPFLPLHTHTHTPSPSLSLPSSHKNSHSVLMLITTNSSCLENAS